jgi:DNA-binding HxlR family transcriptional regulator
MEEYGDDRCGWTIMSDIMETGAKVAPDVRALIIEALSKGPYRPTELLEKLQGPDISEERLKDALDSLIDERRLELSPDRYIKLRMNRPAAAR